MLQINCLIVEPCGVFSINLFPSSPAKQHSSLVYKAWSKMTKGKWINKSNMKSLLLLIIDLHWEQSIYYSEQNMRPMTQSRTHLRTNNISKPFPSNLPVSATKPWVIM